MDELGSAGLYDGLSRRQFLTSAAVAGGAVAAGLTGTPVLSQPRKITLAWSQASFCQVPVPIALERGYFEKNGLQVEVLNWSGASDQLLEALATGKAEVGVGLIHRWVKPLEAGLDVKLVGSVHGGCLRLVGVNAAGVTQDVKTLKGKVIGVADLNAPAKQFYSIHLAKKGLDVEKDVEWRVYPADLLDVAVKKGEVHAIADGDPNLYLIEKRNPGVFTELGNSAKGEYAEKICCVLGAGGKFAREERKHVAGVVRALAQASQYVAENPNESARIFAKYTPKFEVDDLQRLLAELTYKHHPAGSNLRDEVRDFAADFRSAGILKKSTDPVRFANHVSLDVLS
ncbi:ABC transporter substrate-binding protein [Diaphorobacter ruginosibacter]|uniref:ABC transporter substrate-binding protein n=1 Tax=Diaphorobacter ruginosibacter TaxID=1715720 RepID=UPI003340A6A9